MSGAAWEQIDGLDRTFVGGFGRLVPEQHAALGSFANTFAGSPLAGSLASAVRALAASEAPTEPLVALAAGRAALLGALADALLAESGVPLVPAAEAAAPAIPVALRPRLEGLRQWLVELALAGFGQLDAAALTPALQTLPGIQESPELSRLGALLTGFLHELLAHAPTSALPEVPRRRWVDLWSRCLLGTVALPEVPAVTEIRGSFSVLGADVRHHDQLVSVVVHGVLDAGGAPRFAHATLSSWKVDAIAGPDVWNLLRPRAPELLAALASPATLKVSGTLSSTAALDIRSVDGSTPFDPFSVDLSEVQYTPRAPRDRHPLGIAIPARDALDPVDLSRSGPLLDLSADHPDAASVIGLRRWDDGWRFQPLLLKTKKGKILGAGTTIAAADKVKADARAVLAERAQKLLRQS